MAKGLHKYSVQESNNAQLGQAGFDVFINGATPSNEVGTWVALQALGVSANALVLVHAELEDVAERPEKSDPKNFTGMKFTHALIKHLDQLYSKMLAGEVKELASEPKYNPKIRVIEGQTTGLVLEEKEAYFNPGNSAVTESV